MIIKIEEIGVESSLIESVLALHRRNSGTLGFLPRGAFLEQASRGFLFGAVVEENELAGYALYYLPRREIKLTHLCVDARFREGGVARELIDELCRRYPERLGIRVSCRRDFPANEIWPHLDFAPLSDNPGRSLAGHLLTNWWKDFGHPTLFSQPGLDIGPSTVACLDTDVFIDLDSAEDRPQSKESKGLLADWVADQATFLLTKEVAHEINQQSDATARRIQLARCQNFRQANEVSETWEKSRAALIKIIGGSPVSKHGKSDLNHVARTHAAGVRYFVTRDEGLRRKYSEAAGTLGVRITSPGEFVTELWSLQDESYAPAQLSNTNFALESLAGIDLNTLVPTFLMTGAGERLRALTKVVRELEADTPRADGRVVTDDGTPVALMIRKRYKYVLDVPILRVIGKHQPTIGRHIAHMQSKFAVDSGLLVTKITDPNVSSQLARALSDEGYQNLDGVWWSVSIPFSGSRRKLANLLDSMKGVPKSFELDRASFMLRKKTLPATVVADIEQRFWPAKVWNSGIPTFLVPIRPWYAMELFDNALSSSTLFRQMPLGIYREQVYYRSPRPSCGLVAPARILWYVSQQTEVAGSGMIRACSQLFEITADDSRTLYRRNSQLGVYALKDVQQVARGGKAMALRFGRTEPFSTPISLLHLREIASRAGYDNLPLRAPWRIPEQMFHEIYERGTVGTR